MTIRIDIPDDHEPTLRRAWGDDLERAVLEALAIEGYRSARLSAAEVGRLLGHSDRWETERWLAAHSVPLNYTQHDLDADRETLDRVLGKPA